MVRHKLGKWNLGELVKNPNRKTIDKKLIKIESKAKIFERTKKSLNQKIQSENLYSRPSNTTLFKCSPQQPAPTLPYRFGK